MPLASGSRLGPYEILSPLGAGGMGEVYLARDTRLGRTVAIKVLQPAFSDDPSHRARIEREAKTIASLSHPYICTGGIAVPDQYRHRCRPSHHAPDFPRYFGISRSVKGLARPAEFLVPGW